MTGANTAHGSPQMVHIGPHNGLHSYVVGYTRTQWGIHQAFITSQILKDSEVTPIPKL